MAFGSPEILVRTRDRDDGRAVELVGELDLHNVAAVHAQLDSILGREPLPRRILLDLTELRYIDAVGISMLVRAQQDARSLGASLQVVSMSPAITRRIELAGLAALLTGTGR